MAEHNLDAWVYPSWSGSGIAAQAGYPSICVPAGFSDEGMPLGLTFFQSEYLAYWNEQMAASLIALAPTFALFLAFQRYFVQGVVMTGLKG